MNNTKKLALSLATGMALAASGAGFAGTDTGTLNVTAEIKDSCTIGDATLAAGDVDPTANQNVDFSTSVNVTCTSGTTADIGLDEGTGASATVATRKMTGSGVNTLNYTIYQDAGRTTLWGNTVLTDTKAITGTGASAAHTLYGRIPAGQTSATVDSYSDSVTITVTF